MECGQSVVWNPVRIHTSVEWNGEISAEWDGWELGYMYINILKVAYHLDREVDSTIPLNADQSKKYCQKISEDYVPSQCKTEPRHCSCDESFPLTLCSRRELLS